MQKAYLNLVKYALDDGNTVSAYDGEDWLKRSRSYNKIKGHIEAVEESVLIIRDPDGRRLGTAYIALEYHQAPDETIYDYTASDYMQEWEQQYHG